MVDPGGAPAEGLQRLRNALNRSQDLRRGAPRAGVDDKKKEGTKKDETKKAEIKKQEDAKKKAHEAKEAEAKKKAADAAAKKKEADEAKKKAETAKARNEVAASWIKSMTWRQIGPTSMGGRIVDLAVVETQPSRFWIATASGGIFKTENNGVTYKPQFQFEN